MKKIISAVSAAIIATTMISVVSSVSAADGVTYKISNDRNQIVMFDIPVNHDYRREYRINSSGYGKLLEDTDCFYVTAKIEDISKLPKNMLVKRGNEIGLPDIDGVYIYTEDSVIKVPEIENPDIIYHLKQNTAQSLASELTEIDGVSDIQIFQSKSTADFSLSGNIYQVADISYSYKYNESDFSALTDKGYTVSKIEYSEPNDYFELSIIPPEYNEKSANGNNLYQSLLDIAELDLPEGVNVRPIITYQGSGNKTIQEKYIIIGDLNNNFNVDLYDAICVAEYIIGTKKLSNEEIVSADINRDGKVNLYDAIGIAETLL